MTLTWTLVAIFSFILLKSGMDARSRRETQRLKVLEQALRGGHLDAEAKDELMHALTGRNVPPRSGAATRTVPAGHAHGFLGFLAFVGWMALCVGGSFGLIELFTSRYDLEIAAAILCCVGFGLVTLPFVIRELNTTPRRRAPTEQQRQPGS